ncbi:MAG TPA: acyltransferase [Candidatus Limnocylindrales bacterium]|nr:acyltransferase [Candidatus Limnocylindrales bacterium]
MTQAVRRFFDYYRAPRVLGLDVLRIVASLTIVAYHGSTQASFYNRGLLRHGYLAVDIFFVLSGFLLTRQALKLRTNTRLMSFATRFWTRRWFRIIPAYWVMLGLITLGVAYLPIRANMSLADLPRHLLFLQTLFPPNRYTVTWSLVTEEWFYLALPFMLALFFLVPRRNVRVAGVLLILLIPSVVRAIMVQHGETPVLPQARFDGLVVGAGLGVIWSLVPQWKGRLHDSRKWLLAVGVLGAVFMFVATTRLNDGLVYWTAGLLAFNLFIGMTIPAMTVLQWPRFLPIGLAAFVTFLSDLTYPLYLVHDIGYTIVDATGIHSKALYFAVALPFIFLCAVVLHFAVERPFLAWRARIDSSTKRTVASPGQVHSGLQAAGAEAAA